jgi:hypothetical protein
VIRVLGGVGYGEVHAFDYAVEGVAARAVVRRDGSAGASGSHFSLSSNTI